MKRLLLFILVLTLLVVTGTLVSADGQTRRYRSKLNVGTLSPALLTNDTN